MRSGTGRLCPGQITGFEIRFISQQNKSCKWKLLHFSFSWEMLAWLEWVLSFIINPHCLRTKNIGNFTVLKWFSIFVSAVFVWKGKQRVLLLFQLFPITMFLRNNNYQTDFVTCRSLLCFPPNYQLTEYFASWFFPVQDMKKKYLPVFLKVYCKIKYFLFQEQNRNKNAVGAASGRWWQGESKELEHEHFGRSSGIGKALTKRLAGQVCDFISPKGLFV